MEIGICHQSLGDLRNSMDCVFCVGTESDSGRDDKRASLSLAVCAKSGLGRNVAVCLEKPITAGTPY